MKAHKAQNYYKLITTWRSCLADSSQRFSGVAIRELEQKTRECMLQHPKQKIHSVYCLTPEGL